MELLLSVVRSEGITALVATHDEALTDLADQVISLEDGSVSSVSAVSSQGT
jgi:putative ABC transport system ATP-binding protein